MGPKEETTTKSEGLYILKIAHRPFQGHKTFSVQSQGVPLCHTTVTVTPTTGTAWSVLAIILTQSALACKKNVCHSHLRPPCFLLIYWHPLLLQLLQICSNVASDAIGMGLNLYVFLLLMLKPFTSIIFSKVIRVIFESVAKFHD